MTLTELMDRAALLCGITSITGCLVICAIFSLYALEERLAEREERALGATGGVK